MSEIAYLQLLSPQGPPPVRIDANKTMEMATPATPIMQLVEEYGDIVHNPHATPPPYMYTTPKGWPIVQIGFWGPSSSTDNDVLQENGCFFNLAACWTRTPGGGGGVSFTHCEIRFANNYVCSIHEHTLRPPHGERVPGIVHCRQRELDTRNYHFYDLPLRAAEHDAMFRMACAYAADKVCSLSLSLSTICVTF